MVSKAQLGLIGLGVMGENLTLNIERNGYSIAIYNRSSDKTDSFLATRAKGKNIQGYKDIDEFISSLETPRKVILLVKAGEAVDKTIEKIQPYLSKGDIIVDGGNSHFMDTRRREKALRASGIFLIGSGISGGEEGALWGPSLMPGGARDAYEQVHPVWEAIAAKSEGQPCVAYLGTDGAGHFVKMVHNGIEYGDMQLIAEAYDILAKGLGMRAKEISAVFGEWNKTQLSSYLIEITAQILSVDDPDTGKPLVELISDKAQQKGTGKWTAQSAYDFNVPIPTIDAALTARLISALKEERVVAAKYLTGTGGVSEQTETKLLVALRDALFASKLCCYAQGFALISAASSEYQWNTNLAETARIWQGGCIIRAVVLKEISQDFKDQPTLPNLFLSSRYSGWLKQAQGNWRLTVSYAQSLGIPVPALSASLAYFDSYRSVNLPQNLTQAQRDFFGAHMYERVDKPELGFVHTDWHSLLKAKARSQ